MENPQLKETVLLLEKSFGFPMVQEIHSEEDLVALLTPVIHQLLNREFERLLQICYRIDLGEGKLNDILYASPPDQMAGDLAKAIVARQKLKLEIRKKYSDF